MRWVRGGGALNEIVGKMLASVTTSTAGQTSK
jgi:hypothetical protein